MGLLQSLRKASRPSRPVFQNRYRQSRRLGGDEQAVFSVAPALAIAGAIVGAFIVVLVAALFIGDFFSATATAVDAFENTSITTGNEEADNIKENVFPIIIGLTALFGIAGLIIGAIAIKKGR